MRYQSPSAGSLLPAGIDFPIIAGENLYTLTALPPLPAAKPSPSHGGEFPFRIQPPSVLLCIPYRRRGPQDAAVMLLDAPT